MDWLQWIVTDGSDMLGYVRLTRPGKHTNITMENHHAIKNPL